MLSQLDGMAKAAPGKSVAGLGSHRNVEGTETQWPEPNRLIIGCSAALEPARSSLFRYVPGGRPPNGMRHVHKVACGSSISTYAVAFVTLEPRSVTKLLVDFRPVAVSLNEVCRHQFTALRYGLRRSRYRMEGRWIETMDTSKNCAGNREGLALLRYESTMELTELLQR